MSVKQYDLESKAYTTTGTASAYTLVIPKLLSLYDELTIVVEFHITNNATASLNINSLGAVAITTSEGNAIGAGDLKTTGRYTLVYDAGSNSFIINQMVDSEIQNIVGGNGTIIPGFNEPYADDIYTTREPINEGQHCSYGIYGIYLVKDDENIRESLNPGPGYPVININFGQCFELFETNNVVDIISKLLLSYGVGTTVDYSLTADIYSISGTYGVDAVPTGPSLYNSSISGNCNGITEPTLTFNFSTPIPAGQYCVKITGTLSKSSGSDVRSNLDVQILGTNSPYYAGNTVNGSTPISGQNMYINIITSDIGVFLSNGISILTSDWRGIATETKGVNESIVLQKRGETTQTGASNDGTMRYLSDVYGELSLTPGTNVRMIAQGSGTDKVWIGRTQYHEMNDINQGEVYYTNTGGLCGGWFKNAVGSYVTTAMSISVSEDNITRELLQSNQYDQSTGGQNIGIQAYIQAGYYFKIDATSTTTITSERYYFNPIK